MEREEALPRHAAQAATAACESAAERANQAHAELGSTRERLDEERLAHAATQARLDGVHAQLADCQSRLEIADARCRDAEDRARRNAEAAHERAAGAERRAAFEIENERAGRARSDKRADGLERRLDSLKAGLQAAAVCHLQESIALRAELEQERVVARRHAAVRDDIANRLQAAEAELVDARLAQQRALAQAQGVMDAIGRFEQLSKVRSRRAPSRKEATPP